MSDIKYFMRLMLESTIFEKVVVTLGALVTCFMGFYNSDVIDDRTVVVVTHGWICFCFVEQVAKGWYLGRKWVVKSWDRCLDFMVAVAAFGLFVAGQWEAFTWDQVNNHNDVFCMMVIATRTIRIIFLWPHLRKLNVILTIVPFMVNSLVRKRASEPCGTARNTQLTKNTRL